MPPKQVAIIGGGPAGLAAAERLGQAGLAVTVYDRKPSVGRKFLMAGRGGLNLTHSEDKPEFMARYCRPAPQLQAAIAGFTPFDLRRWCEDLGQDTFIGSSGRVFPKSLKASPLLRVWLARLEENGIRFALGRDWTGWNAKGELVFMDADGGEETVRADAILLALGGGSWARLGSDGSWVGILEKQNINITPLRPANCGFHVGWSDLFRARFAGHPLKTIIASFAGQSVPGEIMITAQGIEGGPVYALSAAVRDAGKGAVLEIDLKPGLSPRDVAAKLSRPRAGQSLPNFLKKSLSLPPVAINLLYESRPDLAAASAEDLSRLIKACPIRVLSPFPIDRAISTAGGLRFDALDDRFMIRARPGVFAAGEMLDWDAPTGGYLLQGCFSTGIAAARGIIAWLADQA